MNKKALYESIMKSVAKEVKKALNEAVHIDLDNIEPWDALLYFDLDDTKARELVGILKDPLKANLLADYLLYAIGDIDEC